MEKFFDKYLNLIRFILYSIAVLLGLIIIFLFFQVSEIWVGLLHEIWKGSMPFLVALLLGYLVHPVILKVEKLKVPRLVAIFLFFILIIGVFGIGIIWFIPKFIGEILELGQNLSTYFLSAQEQIEALEYYIGFDIGDWIMMESSAWVVQLSEGFQNIGIWFLDFIFSFIGSLSFIIIVPIALFYILMDYEKILIRTLRLFPEKGQIHLQGIAIELDNTIGAYVRGLILVMMLTTLISTLLFLIFGIDYAFLFGFFIGLCNFIPILGPIIGVVPVVIFALTISWHHVIIVILIQLAIQILEGNILQPLIIGRKLEMHPLFMMMLVLIAGQVFGMKGALFAIPIFLFIRTLRHYLKTTKNSTK